MKRRLSILALIAMAALVSIAMMLVPPAYAGGATRISGTGYFNDGVTCSLEDVEGNPDFASILTGDLEGCLYAFVESASCSSGGVYLERGTNLFVGSYNGKEGTFGATYLFTAKFEECNVIDGVAIPGGAEIFGRCHHPIIGGSGTGDFTGVSGRLDFKDNIEDGEVVNFPYRGHLRWSGLYGPE